MNEGKLFGKTKIFLVGDGIGRVKRVLYIKDKNGIHQNAAKKERPRQKKQRGRKRRREGRRKGVGERERAQRNQERNLYNAQILGCLEDEWDPKRKPIIPGIEFLTDRKTASAQI